MQRSKNNKPIYIDTCMYTHIPFTSDFGHLNSYMIEVFSSLSVSPINHH